MHDRQLLMLERAIEYIESRLTEPITVVHVCSQFKEVSQWEFQRWFRAHTGDSIGNYLRSRRLSQSLLDLRRYPDRNILEVAIEYQFNSHEAFSRAFKEYFNETPGRARRSKVNYDRLLKPRASKSLLNHMKSGIQRQPDIKVLGPFRFVGLQTEIRSFHQHEDYINKAPKIWNEFISRQCEFVGYADTLKYGVAVGDMNSSSENLTYLAAFNCNQNLKIPQGMVEVMIPTQTYALFVNQGLADKSRETIDYIYGFWLPDSNFKRASGYDFEIFDERYNLKSEDSVSTYCLPIVELSSEDATGKKD